MSLKEFLDKNHSTINTTSHVLTYFQNSKIQKNQRQLAQLELVNNSLLNEQNELRKKEVERFEKLMDQNEKEKRKKERKEKLKTEVLELGPSTKSLLKKIEKSKGDYDNLTISFLLRHSKLNIQKMREHKSLINDINFFDYLHELDERLSEINSNYDGVIEDFSSELAQLLVQFQSVVLGAELLSKSKKDVLNEQSKNTKKYLKRLKTNITKELNDNNNSLKSLTDHLKKYNSLGDKINGVATLHDLRDYPLPISFDEGEYLLGLITEIENDTDTFVNEVDSKVDELLSVFKGKGEDIIGRVEKIISKDATKLTLEDLEFLVQNSTKDVVLIAKEKIEDLLDKLRSGIKKDKSIFENMWEDAQEYYSAVWSTFKLSSILDKVVIEGNKFDSIIVEHSSKKILSQQSDQLNSGATDNLKMFTMFSLLSIVILSITKAVFFGLLPFVLMLIFGLKAKKEQNKAIKEFKKVVISEIDDIDRKISTIKINMR